MKMTRAVEDPHPADGLRTSATLSHKGERVHAKCLPLLILFRDPHPRALRAVR